MKLFIATSGGLGNIRLQGELDTDELDSSLADRTKRVLQPERLESLQAGSGRPVADAAQYEVGLFLDDGLHQYTLEEGNLTSDVLEVLQDLVHELILKKRRAQH